MPITERVNALLVQNQLQKAAMNAYQQKASALYILEAKYTLFHIDRLLHSKNQSGLEITLGKFLKKRWKRLNNTDAQYFHDTQNPANVMCIEIAKTLGDLQHKPYLLFLIPALGSVPVSEYVTSSYDDKDLVLNQLMLSDDGTRIIHIPDALEFSEQDNVLKHTSLFHGQQRDLTFSEEMRLLARDPTVDNYYHAIRDKINFQLHGETAGAHLTRLIHGLRAGGSHGSGSEMLTGHEANEAIVDFSIFLESLSKKKRKKLLRTHKFDRWRSDTPQYASIGQSWTFLKDPVQAKNGRMQAVAYCVELIADALEEILQENPMLYQLMPFEHEGVGTLAMFEEAVTQCRMSMLDALKASEAHRYYGNTGDDKLALGVLSKISRDKAFYLDHADIAYVASYYFDDNPVLKTLSNSILCHTREYMTSEHLRAALGALPRQMAHEVEQHVFPKPNCHLFFSDEQPGLEPLSKKAKHML